MKKLFLAAVVALTFTACNNTTDQAATAGDEAAIMTVDELEMNIENLVDQPVVVAGDVDHVCKHGGTKMVILGDSASIHIKATEESGNFRADEVMDQRVIVTGVVSEFRVDEGFIAEKEAELEEAIAMGGEVEEEDCEEHKDEDCEEHKDSDCKDEEKHDEKGNFPDNDNKHKKEIAGLQKQIEGLKAMLEEARAEGKDHVSFYSVDAASYVIDEDADVKSEGKAYEDAPIEMAEEAEEAHDHDGEDHEGHDHE